MTDTEECGICGRSVTRGSTCDRESSLSCVNNLGEGTAQRDDFVDAVVDEHDR